MNTNDGCGMATFKWLATILSFAISLPAYFDESSKMAFILTVCVFVFGKFIENVEGISQYTSNFHTIFCIIGSIIGVIAIGICFYFFAAISNVTEIVKTDNNYSIENNDQDDINEDDKEIQLFSEEDMSKYPLFNGENLYIFLFMILLFYIGEETVFCGCDFCKYVQTKNKIKLIKNKNNDLLDISL